MSTRWFPQSGPNPIISKLSYGQPYRETHTAKKGRREPRHRNGPKRRLPYPRGPCRSRAKMPHGRATLAPERRFGATEGPKPGTAADFRQTGIGYFVVTF